MGSELDNAQHLVAGSVHDRVPSYPVRIGKVWIGGQHPIAVQSMTTTRTSDAVATARQVIQLARGGCEIVRVTVPSGPDADALPEIRRILAAERVDVPLVADIHFTPKLALQVVEHVDKVRVNPGNFTDRKAIGGGSYDESRWQRDLDRLHELFAPVVDRARALGVALRIGTNHGSLSDRIMHRYGDSPEGMVQSALEFVQIAEDRGHDQLVISIKASNTQVMISAYRLLAQRLLQRGRLYPLHLGVTEAGGGDDGRIKSAVGIATLLNEGLGDTVRVSLTEDPVHEVPVARELVARFQRPLAGPRSASPLPSAAPEVLLSPLERCSHSERLGPITLGAQQVPRVEAAIALSQLDQLAALTRIQPPLELVDLMIAPGQSWEEAARALELQAGRNFARGVTLLGAPRSWFNSRALDTIQKADWIDRLGWEVESPEDLDPIEAAAAGKPVLLQLIPEQLPAIVEQARKRGTRALVALSSRVVGGAERIAAHRAIDAWLRRHDIEFPLVLCDTAEAAEDRRLGIAGRLGGLLVDGVGDAIRLQGASALPGLVQLGHGVLQAARRRMERAEYIACPSCGRTLFDLETTTERIRQITSHLKLKIAVMGCVVNGPGEMADADFGFVGWGEGKVALFVGKKLVERDIPYPEAPDRLVELIKQHGRWHEPSIVSHFEQSAN